MLSLCSKALFGVPLSAFVRDSYARALRDENLRLPELGLQKMLTVTFLRSSLSVESPLSIFLEAVVSRRASDLSYITKHGNRDSFLAQAGCAGFSKMVLLISGFPCAETFANGYACYLLLISDQR